MKNLEEKETILILHSMFCNSDVYLTLLKSLEKDYRLVSYDFSNHNNRKKYKNSKNEAKLIIKNLISDNIFKLRAIIGFSLGSRILLDIINENKKYNNIIKVDTYILEGAPVYNNARLRRILLDIINENKKYNNIIKVDTYILEGAPVYNNARLRRFLFLLASYGTIKLKDSKYIYYKVKKRVIKPINEILDVIKKYNKKCVKRIVKDCTTFSFFEIDEKVQKKLNFLYPYFDINILSYLKLKKYYKNANYIFYSGLHTHCSKVFIQSSKYINEQILPILNNTRREK